MKVMEETISGSMVRSIFEKMGNNLAINVAIVGAGPSGLVAARDLARAGYKVCVYESKLAPGGGVWGGGMLMNEVAVQNDAAEILHEFGITTVSYDADYHTVDSVELASGLIFGARKAGATIFNTVRVEDIVVHDGVISGVVINWNPVRRLEMHVDPIVVTARAVVDGTGHPSGCDDWFIPSRREIEALREAINLGTVTGGMLAGSEQDESLLLNRYVWSS